MCHNGGLGDGFYGCPQPTEWHTADEPWGWVGGTGYHRFLQPTRMAPYYNLIWNRRRSIASMLPRWLPWRQSDRLPNPPYLICPSLAHLHSRKFPNGNFNCTTQSIDFFWTWTTGQRTSLISDSKLNTNMTVLPFSYMFPQNTWWYNLRSSTIEASERRCDANHWFLMNTQTKHDSPTLFDDLPTNNIGAL